jgi:hypothetical protein
MGVGTFLIYCHSSPVCISEGDVKTDYLGAITLEKDCGET